MTVTNQEIADHFGLSLRTVSKYRAGSGSRPLVYAALSNVVAEQMGPEKVNWASEEARFSIGDLDYACNYRHSKGRVVVDGVSVWGNFGNILPNMGNWITPSGRSLDAEALRVAKKHLLDNSGK